MGSCANFATAFFKVSRSSEVGLKDDIFAAAADGITCIRVLVIYGGAYQLFTGSHPDHTRKPTGSLTTGIKDAADLGAYYFVPSIDSLRNARCWMEPCGTTLPSTGRFVRHWPTFVRYPAQNP